MSSSREGFFAALSQFIKERTAIRFVLRTELSRVLLRGYVFHVSVADGTIELESEPRDRPSLRLTFICDSAVVVEEKGFDTAVLEEFGDLFDELPPEKRGALWAGRFEKAWIVKFSSGATCVVAVSG